MVFQLRMLKLGLGKGCRVTNLYFGTTRHAVCACGVCNLKSSSYHKATSFRLSYIYAN